MTKRKRTNNDLQNTTQKTQDWTTQTPLKTGDELWCSGRVSSSWSACGIRRVTLVTNLVIRHEWGKDHIVITTNGTYIKLRNHVYLHIVFFFSISEI
jgi:hypothetical protein